jgi:hypothetical protein
MNQEDRKMWEDRIKNYKSSSKIAATWCEENNVSIYSLRHYICKFNKEDKLKSTEKNTKPKWKELEIQPTQENKNTNTSLKVTIGKATIEIGSNFDQVAFEAVVKVLSRC